MMPGRRLIAVAAALLLAGAGQAHAEEMEHHLKTWMDKDGVVHMTLGPSTKARAKAQKLSLVPHSTRKKEKVRDSTAFDEHIALVLIDGGDDRAVPDQKTHGRWSARSA